MAASWPLRILAASLSLLASHNLLLSNGDVLDFRMRVKATLSTSRAGRPTSAILLDIFVRPSTHWCNVSCLVHPAQHSSTAPTAIPSAHTMLGTRCLSRATIRAPHAPRLSRNITTRPNQARARAIPHPYAQRRQQHFVRSVGAVTVLWATASAWQWYNGERFLPEVHAEEPPQDQQELEFEKPRPKPTSEEDNRKIISSQHLQVRKSWENPGVYAWGSNSGKVVAPDSNDSFVKTPRRIAFFDGKLLRDIKLDRAFGAAIDERGNLLQWGTAFSKETTQPTLTLQGKNLTSLSISRDRIIALSKSGDVYSIPVSQDEQRNGPKPASTSWIPFWGGSNNISYRLRTPQNLSWNERVTQISSGLEHALMLTSTGRVFSFASGTQDYPRRGQLGLAGLTWETRPEGSFDAPHELTTLKGFPIQHIATGDFHSLVSDASGRAFGFGDVIPLHRTTSILANSLRTPPAN